MVWAQETSSGREYYGYQADNKRVYRLTASGQEQVTFYGAYGEKLGVYAVAGTGCSYPYGYCFNALTPQGTSVWFAGKLLTDGNNALAQDRSGTNRVSGARFYPYGEEITSPATANDRVKFGTYNRDAYTGLDYADQRFYANLYGRFNTPDPYQASGGPSDPGSWNRYSYTGGDPVNRFDPTGRIYCGVALAPGDEDTDLDGSCAGGPGSGDIPQYIKGCTPYILAFGAQADSYGASLPDCENMGGYVGPLMSVAVQTCVNWGCMPAALARAKQALQNNPDCASLFGTDTSRANGFDPLSVISQVFSQSGGYVQGSPVGTSFVPLVQSIFGNTAVTSPVIGLGGGASVFIAGGSDSPWNVAGSAGYTNDQAAILLHELGHVYNLLPGSGGSPIVWDGVGSTTSLNNQKEVDSKCFPGLSLTI